VSVHRVSSRALCASNYNMIVIYVKGGVALSIAERGQVDRARQALRARGSEPPQAGAAGAPSPDRLAKKVPGTNGTRQVLNVKFLWFLTPLTHP
jgi:hypothetical protein